MSAPVSGENTSAETIAIAMPSDPAARQIDSTDAQAARSSQFSGPLALWLKDHRRYVPGAWVAIVVSLAATLIAERSSGSQMLYALLFGIAFRFLYDERSCDAGIEFASRVLLRFAVVLLGAHLTFAQIAHLGWSPIVVIGVATPATVLFGMAVAKLLQRRHEEGLLFGASVGICGASAAAAIASVLPQSKENRHFMLLTIIGVTGLSTLAMMFYPMLTGALGLSSRDAGIFLGATIHNIPQAVAAGYVVGQEAGDIATYVKLVRITILVPAMLMCSWMYRLASNGDTAQSGKRKNGLPLFLYGFALLVVVNSAGVIPQTVSNLLSDLSRWCMVVAIAAVGLKTSLREIMGIGWRPVMMLVANTVFLAALVLALMWLEKSL